MQQKSGIIIQARTGSSRLPGKMTLPFADGKNLLELMLSDFKSTAGNIPFVVATTLQPQDDIIASLCKNMDIPCFRGSEQDVLERFTQTANHFGFSKLIRVCADNPFFDLPSTLELLKIMEDEGSDYAGFSLNGKPSISTHIGLWGEAVTLDALIKVSALTSDLKYREHVTNYIYTHPADFQVSLRPAPYEFSNRTDLRFTLDTAGDFELHRELYQIAGRLPIPERLYELRRITDENSKFSTIMREQIGLNTK